MKELSTNIISKNLELIARFLDKPVVSKYDKQCPFSGTDYELKGREGKIKNVIKRKDGRFWFLIDWSVCKDWVFIEQFDWMAGCPLGNAHEPFNHFIFSANGIAPYVTEKTINEIKQKISVCPSVYRIIVTDFIKYLNDNGFHYEFSPDKVIEDYVKNK